MGDFFDKVAEVETAFRDAALAEARSKGQEHAPTGECLWCAEPLDDDRRWCDADCRDDWQSYREAQASGRIVPDIDIDILS